ncbi:MAG: hypothetical protein K5876_03420 [Ruminiclostridium sp.]|nr:hypothetical protein [Ruminiclostridium sp.]
MKRTSGFAALLMSAAVLGSCAQQPKAPDSPDALISNIMSEAAAAQTTKSPQTSETSQTTQPPQTAAASEQASAGAGSEVDLDLTVMNSTMIYSIIYDIMVNPDNYYGKSLMVDGYFDTMTDDALGTRYFFVVVPDATACCVQGLEFILPGKGTYPDDYPAVQADIRVRGVLDRYEEQGQYYSYIKADSVTTL